MIWHNNYNILKICIEYLGFCICWSDFIPWNQPLILLSLFVCLFVLWQENQDVGILFYLFTLHLYHSPLPPLLPVPTSLLLLPIPPTPQKRGGVPTNLSQYIKSHHNLGYPFPLWSGKAASLGQGEVIKKQAVESMSVTASSPLTRVPTWSPSCPYVTSV